MTTPPQEICCEKCEIHIDHDGVMFGCNNDNCPCHHPAPASKWKEGYYTVQFSFIGKDDKEHVQHFTINEPFTFVEAVAFAEKHASEFGEHRIHSVFKNAHISSLLLEEREKLAKEVEGLKKKTKPTHGACCTCQKCGYSIADADECECKRNESLSEAANLIRKGKSS